MTHKIHVVGIGDNGLESLGQDALKIVEQAELLVGGERHLRCFSTHPAEKFTIRKNLSELVSKIQVAQSRVVVLASGDPLFYGIGAYLLKKLGHEGVEIISNTSSMQLAFARIKQSWQDALLLSCHAKPIAPIIKPLREAKKVGIFTDSSNTPSQIAKALLAKGISDFRAFVCENIGGGDQERITECDLKDLVGRDFSELNVLILIKKDRPVVPDNRHWTFGIPDKAFYQRKPLKGLITKVEVRVIGLSKMKIRPGDIVWDIGAGSGSVSIEAALLGAEVWAIEKNKGDCDIIQNNIIKFGTTAVKVIHGKAPEALSGLPDPDAVFIGGSAGKMNEIVELCKTRLKPGGRLVINAVTLENIVNTGDITLVQVNRSRPILNLTRFESLNPVFISAWEKDRENK